MREKEAKSTFLKWKCWIGGGECEEFKIGSFKMSQQIFIDKVFFDEVKKQEEGERTFFKKGRQQTRFSKNLVVEKTGECVKGEKKGRKSIIKSKRIFKKKGRYIQKGQQKRNTRKTDVQEWEQKRRMSKNTREYTQKRKNWKKQRERTNMQKTYKCVKMSHKKVKSFWKCRSVKYVFLIDRDNKKRKKRDNRWTNRWTKGGHKGVTHACKKWKVEELLMQKRKGTCCSKKSKKVKEKKNEFKKKEIMKIKGQTKKRMKKEVNAKRDEQKQEVMKKGWKKNL